MKILKFPSEEVLKGELKRPTEAAAADVRPAVEEIFAAVRNEGDKALVRYNDKFDGVSSPVLKVETDELLSALKELPSDLIDAIRTAETNILRFHEAQRRAPLSLETTPGVTCERRSVPIGRVGLYIPGGTAPLFSTLLMLAVPARLAGCKEIVLVSPPPINPVILAVASLLEVDEVYQVGGAQAIAALSLGTETIKPVSKIFGPGNQYVTCGKQLAQQRTSVAIDMPAGPSELLVIADEGANPQYVAADLLSQAEHGADSQVVLLTDSEKLLESVQKETASQAEELPRREIAEAALNNSVAVLVSDLTEAFRISNSYAPEHLIVATRDAKNQVSLITDAGSVFLGDYTPESLGDYASGTNHTLPTGGTAKAYSGVSLESFQKQITFQTATPSGLEALANTVELMATAEGLEAHKRAVSIRRTQGEGK